MSLEKSDNLGTLITVIDKQPLQVSIVLNTMGADSLDRLNHWRYIYLFKDASKESDTQSIIFVVRASRDLLERHFDNKLSELHTNAIRFGLMAISKDPDLGQIDFSVKEYQDKILNSKIQGLELRLSILKLFFCIYKKYPKWEISNEELECNINSNLDEISQWAESLTEENTLRKSTKTLRQRYGKSQVTRDFYHLNPDMFSRVQEELTKVKNMSNDKGPIDFLRVFLSYSHKDRKIAGRLKKKLNSFGIDVFLAHEHIKVDEKWEPEILKYLRNCHVLIGLITKHFNRSEWTDQEIGNAIGGDKIIISLLLDGKLKGFAKSKQALLTNSKGVSYTYGKIISELSSKPNSQELFRNSLICQFGRSASFNETMKNTPLLLEYEPFTKQQFALIGQFITENDQLYNCGAVQKNLERFIRENEGMFDKGLLTKVYSKLGV